MQAKKSRGPDNKSVGARIGYGERWQPSHVGVTPSGRCGAGLAASLPPPARQSISPITSFRNDISSTSGRNPRRILSALNFIWLVSPLQDQSGTRGVNPLDIDQAQLVQVVEVCVGCEQSEIVDMSDSGNPQIVFAHVPAV